MQHKFLIHDKKDSVGVAVGDIKVKGKVTGVVLEDNKRVKVEAKNNIPLGHKIAICPIATGDVVIKYGVPIGKATRSITKGAHVHIHNLKSARW